MRFSLSSSCCVVQLLLNYLTIGCAGFSVLDPLRKPFLALTFGGLGVMTFRNYQNSGTIWNRNWFILVSASVLLASSPEILRAINLSTPNTAKATNLKSMEMDITGMKCESCSNAVKNSLKNVNGVIDCKVSRASQTAVVYYQKERENLIHDLEEAVSKLHFTGKVRQISKEEL